jgi:hypothetical protein
MGGLLYYTKMHNAHLEHIALTYHHSNCHFCFVFSAIKFANIQLIPAFLNLKPNQNCSVVSDSR